MNTYVGGMGRLYVVVNTDLGMSIGKVAAQVAHVVARHGELTPKTVIVLQSNFVQMANLNRYLHENGIEPTIYIDEGVNEVPPMSATAMAFNLINDESPEWLAGFKLLTPKKRRLWPFRKGTNI